MAPISASPPSVENSLRRFAACLAVIGTLALVASAPLPAVADPIELKLSFFGSEQGATFLAGIKPFVDAVNNDGKGLVNIRVYANGALGRLAAQQPQLLLDSGADMAFLVPGQTPYRFPDNALLELPGMFESAREGTLVYTRLIAEKALRGYDDFLVIGAYTPAPNVIHSRKPTESIEALKGQKIRANNPIEADALAGLGATPTVLEMQKVAPAIQAGAIDGTTSNPFSMYEFGIPPVAPYHFLLRLGTAPLVLVMSRKRLASLPQEVQTVIGKYSGNWTAAGFVTRSETGEKGALAQLNADPEQHVIAPSAADQESAQRIYQALSESWAASNPRNRELLRALRKELAAVRSGD